MQTLVALDRLLRKSWRSVSLTTEHNLMGSMPDRLKAVIRKKGDTIPYYEAMALIYTFADVFVPVSVPVYAYAAGPVSDLVSLVCWCVTVSHVTAAVFKRWA